MLTSRAAIFAARCHTGQFRKYKNDFGLTQQYIAHPARVAAMVAHCHSKFEEPDYAIEAAWCHDVIEDCDISIDRLVNETSPACAHLVSELTNPSKMFPNLSRYERKKMDREHLRDVSREAKIIKMFDRIDNLNDMTNAPRDFAYLYLRESEYLAEELRAADREVYIVLATTINAVRKYFDRQGNVS